ncbi:MAG: nucleotide triphosphate diphosphatase NUDT15 [Candidatus Woesearchaeota archaeon]
MSDAKNKIVCRRPHVGVAVIVVKDGKILLGKRIGAHSSGTWNFPGGKLDFGEEIFDCAKREVLEESGLKIKNLRLGPYTNDYFKSEDLHYITLFVIADYASGTATIMEPDKCLGWRWIGWDKIPSPMFLPITNLLKQKFNPLKK